MHPHYQSLWSVRLIACSLPILVQPPIIKKCLLAGKHVLSEKPIAPDLKQAQELLDWYAATFPQAKGKPVWAVAENFRFKEAYRYGREVIEKMGRVLTFSAFAGNYVAQGGKYYGNPHPKAFGPLTDTYLIQKPNGVKSPPTKVVTFLTVVSTKLPAFSPSFLQ